VSCSRWSVSFAMRFGQYSHFLPNDLTCARRLSERPSAQERIWTLSGQNDHSVVTSGACRRLGLPLYTQRALRRLFITRAIELGVDVKVNAEWQGHEDGGKLTLDTYSHVNPVPFAANGATQTLARGKGPLSARIRQLPNSPYVSIAATGSSLLVRSLMSLAPSSMLPATNCGRIRVQFHRRSPGTEPLRG
jgi:hypothetical protein